MRAEYLTREAYEKSLHNPTHKKIREELLEIDKEIEATVDMGRLKGSQRPPRGLYASQHWSRVYEYPWVVERLREALGSIEGKKILDVGPGISPFPTWLARHGAEVTCVDTAPIELPDVNMIAADIRDWGSTAKYDAITCISVLEHISDIRMTDLITWWVNGDSIVAVTMDIPLKQSNYGVGFGAFVDLMWWLCEWYGECPRYPGTHKLLSSSDFGEQGDEVGRDIGVFLLEVS